MSDDDEIVKPIKLTESIDPLLIKKYLAGLPDISFEINLADTEPSTEVNLTGSEPSTILGMKMFASTLIPEDELWLMVGIRVAAVLKIVPRDPIETALKGLYDG